MICRTLLAFLLGAASWAILAGACEAGNALTEDQIRGAVRGEGISMPVPGELIAAYDKAARPDWSASFRKLPSGAFTSRPQIAINLGLLLADGHLAVEAQDRQELKNISREMKNLAKSLGLEQELVGRSNTISDFADGMQWNALSEELEAVQNEMAAAMANRQDRDLATLMAFGGWLRAMEAISEHLAKDYNAGGARILRQPAASAYFLQRLAAMPARIQESPMVAAMRRSMPEIQAMLSRSSDPLPSAEDAGKLKTLASTLVKAAVMQEK